MPTLIKNLLKSLLSAALICCALFLWNLLTKPANFFLAYSNHLFMLGLLILCVGSFLFVASSGFFDFFQKSWRHLFLKTQGTNKETRLPLSIAAGKAYKKWLSTGFILVFLSIVTLLFIES